MNTVNGSSKTIDFVAELYPKHTGPKMPCIFSSHSCQLIADISTAERKKLIQILQTHHWFPEGGSFPGLHGYTGPPCGQWGQQHKKSASLFLRTFMTMTSLTYNRCFLSSIHTQHQLTVEIVVLCFILGAAKNRLTNTPSVSGNSTPCDHLILPVSLC